MSKLSLGAVALVGAALAALVPASQAAAQAPVKGGTLKYATIGTPGTLDCHAMSTAVFLPPAGPGYSTLVRYDPEDFSRVIGDLAESWTISADGLTYSFKLHTGVKFHDGTPMTSEDVKATFERMRNPPQGVLSLRKSLYAGITAIETPDPNTVVFKLSKADPTLMFIGFANPYGCIYSAKKLAENQKYPDKTVMGTGPFQMTAFNPGAGMTYKRFDDYFQKGLPYLDGLDIVFMVDPAMANAVASGNIDGVFSNIPPTDRSVIAPQRGAKTVFPEGPFNVTNFLNVNTTKKPLDDVRVRRALQYAFDRRTGAGMMSVSFQMKGYGVLFPDGVKYDMSAEEMDKLPGFGPDIAGNRAQSKKLLDEAGVKDLQIVLNNRNSGGSFTPLGVYTVDQLKQIGVTVSQRLMDAGPYYDSQVGLNYDIAIDTNNTNTSDPNEVLVKYLPNSPSNFTGFKDPMLQDLFDKQAVETDVAKRRALVTQFQARVVDQAFVIPFFRSVNMAAMTADLRGWKIGPSPAMNSDLRGVWLDRK